MSISASDVFQIFSRVKKLEERMGSVESAQAYFSKIAAQIEGLKQQAQNALEETRQSLNAMSILKNDITGIQTRLENLVPQINNSFVRIGDDIRAAEDLVSQSDTLLQATNSKFSALPSLMAREFDLLWAPAKQYIVDAKATINQINVAASNALTTANTKITDIPNTVSNAFTPLWNAVKGKVVTFYTGLNTAITAFNVYINDLGNVFVNCKNALSTAYSNINTIVSSMDTYTNGINREVGEIETSRDLFGNFNIPKAIGNILDLCAILRDLGWKIVALPRELVVVFTTLKTNFNYAQNDFYTAKSKLVLPALTF